MADARPKAGMFLREPFSYFTVCLADPLSVLTVIQLNILNLLSDDYIFHVELQDMEILPNTVLI